MILTRILCLPLVLIDVLAFLCMFWNWVPKVFFRDESEFSAPSDASTVKAMQGIPRRSCRSPDKLIDSGWIEDAESTMYHQLCASVDVHADKIALASRQFVDLKKLKQTDRFPQKIFNGTTEITYKQLGEQVLSFGAGLKMLGMEAVPAGIKSLSDFNDATGPFSMVIFEDTCAQWSTALHGAFSQSMVVATCYATLGENAVVQAVNELGATTLLLNWKKVERFVELAQQGKMPALKNIIVSTHELPLGTNITSAVDSSIRIISTDDLIAQGAQQRGRYPPIPPQPSSVAVVMFTSGSTGKPKGVVMSHRNLCSAISGALPMMAIATDDVYISYLPLAHILALQSESACLTVGCKVCYSGPREVAEAMREFQPTIFAGVPKVWQLLQDGVRKQMAKAAKRGGTLGALVPASFGALLDWKTRALDMGIGTPATDLALGLVAAKMGLGRLRLGVSGGGPMSAALQRFCRALFGCPIVQGYALTESCVGGTFTSPADSRAGVVGAPMACLEIMLQSEPEIKDAAGLPYLHTDTVGARGEPVAGRGEICLRGPCVSMGYYRDPCKTAEDFDGEGGWFHTGDIGQWTTDGVLMIVDRKKNLVKLKGGEYVALEAMEAAFSQSPFATAVCVIANGELDRPLAIVRVDNERLEQWKSEAATVAQQATAPISGSSEDLSTLPLTEFARTQEAKTAVLASMKSFGKQAGLTHLELGLKDCSLITNVEWGPGKGLTATMKLDRRAIHKMHEAELKALVESNTQQP